MDFIFYLFSPLSYVIVTAIAFVIYFKFTENRPYRHWIYGQNLLICRRIGERLNMIPFQIDRNDQIIRSVFDQLEKQNAKAEEIRKGFEDRLNEQSSKLIEGRLKDLNIVFDLRTEVDAIKKHLEGSCCKYSLQIKPQEKE